MVYWCHITQDLPYAYHPDWDFLAESTLGPKIHPQRKIGFKLARGALLKCLEEAGLSADIKNLKLLNHCQLKNYPEICLSLSHSQDCGAALVGKIDHFISVGIDIESSERKVSPEVIKRIKNPHDGKYREIELWCLKEAVFKALMNTGSFSKAVEFSSILIQSHAWSHLPSGLKGEWELDEKNHFTIARAFLKR